MEKASNKKMNFLTRVYQAITNFDTYSKFAEESFSKAFVYLTILVLICTILLTVNYTLIFKSELTQGINYLDENVEKFSIKDGIFSYNNDQYAEYAADDNMIPIIIVDTGENPNIDEYKTKVDLYDLGFIILKDRILIQTSSEQQSNAILYTDYNIGDMNKEEILKAINNISTYVFIAIAIFIAEFVEILFVILADAIMLALLGQIIAIILRMRIRFAAAYKIGIYALTLPTILQVIYIIINSRTGFVINNFAWLYMTLSYIYILIAVLMIKTDFINTQRELIRIQLEQKNTHDEMEKGQEEKHKEEQKDKNKENEDKDKKEDNNDEGLDEQTQE